MKEDDIKSVTENSNLGVDRRDFCTSSLSVGVGLVATAVAASVPVMSMMPASDVLASASAEVDISNLTAGNDITIMWRGKPVFIKKRTDDEMKLVRSVAMTELKDPQKDEDRVKSDHEDIVVLVAVCTHLGCVPKGNSGDFGGWFCPCHGSHYDASGRIRQGPAPLNLVVPPYEFLSPTLIKIG
jgi:ubiquinol-cytochrome c reductase iron-sulfur subunit